MTETGGTSEPSPQKDVSGLIARRLDELALERGSEAEEQKREEKATGRPVPAALVLFRRLGEIERDVAARDEHTRRDFAILRYACGLAVLGELMRQDAELTVIYNRHKRRPLTDVLLVTDPQTEVVQALEAQRQQLVMAFPTVGELPLSARQQEVVSGIAGRVGIRSPQPTERAAAGGEDLQLAEPTRSAGGGDGARSRRTGPGSASQCDLQRPQPRPLAAE